LKKIALVVLFLILSFNTACSNDKAIKESKDLVAERKTDTSKPEEKLDKLTTLVEVNKIEETDEDNSELLVGEFKDLLKDIKNYDKVLELLDKALLIVDEEVCQEIIDDFIEYRQKYIYSELDKFNYFDIYEKINNLYSNDIVSFLKFYDIDEIADSSIRDFVLKVRELHITHTEVEGEISYEDDFTWYYRYKDYLSQQLKDYLQTHVVEASKNVAGDGAVLIPWNEIYDRHRMYEDFLRKYPDSKYKEEIVRNCDWYLYMYFHGLDNTTAFRYDSKMNEELRKSYLEKAKYGEDSMANKILALYIPILEKNGHRKTKAVSDFLDEVFTRNDDQSHLLEGINFRGGYGFFRDGRFYPIARVKEMSKAETERLKISEGQIGEMMDLYKNAKSLKRFAFNMLENDKLEVSIIDKITDTVDSTHIFSIDGPYLREKLSRYDSCIYLKTLRDDKDILMKLHEDGEDKILYTGEDYLYSVSPDKSYIAIAYRNRILVLDKDGKMVGEYKDIFELKEIDEGLSILGWSEDAVSLWIEKTYVNDRESFYKIDMKKSKYFQYNVGHLGLSYYTLNATTGKIAYSDYPMFFLDITVVYEFEKSGEKVSLYIYDLETETNIRVCENIVKPFMPRWTNNNTLEYYSSDKHSRVLYEIEDTEDIFEAMTNAKLGNLKVGMTTDEVIKELGGCLDKSDTAACEVCGLEHQEWNYKDQGIKLVMVKEEEGEVVSSIHLISPYNERTDKGIGIGSTVDDVLKAYAKDINAEEGDDNVIVVGSIYGGIVFRIENGAVSSIFIGAGAE